MIHINPGQSQQVSASLYLGPAIASLLKPIAPHLDLTVDYGFGCYLNSYSLFLTNFTFGLVIGAGALFINHSY